MYENYYYNNHNNNNTRFCNRKYNKDTITIISNVSIIINIISS